MRPKSFFSLSLSLQSHPQPGAAAKFLPPIQGEERVTAKAGERHSGRFSVQSADGADWLTEWLFSFWQAAWTFHSHAAFAMPFPKPVARSSLSHFFAKRWIFFSTFEFPPQLAGWPSWKASSLSETLTSAKCLSGKSAQQRWGGDRTEKGLLDDVKSNVPHPTASQFQIKDAENERSG